jgi:hypothetical protein
MRHIRAGLLVVAIGLISAWLGATPARAAVTQPFTLQPGGVATITFVAYCTEFGKFFPQTIVEPSGALAPEPVRAALAYIDQRGYINDEAQALEANIAIWQLAGASRLPPGGSVTSDVVANATAAPADPAGTSILTAAAAGQVRLTLTGWAPIGDKVQILSATDNFYGRGTLTVENLSAQALDLYMPVGTLFPGNEARFQQVGGFATDVQVRNPQLPNTSGSAPPAPLLLAAALGLLAVGARLTHHPRRSALRSRA